jgi:hypothetical protein
LTLIAEPRPPKPMFTASSLIPHIPCPKRPCREPAVSAEARKAPFFL